MKALAIFISVLTLSFATLVWAESSITTEDRNKVERSKLFTLSTAAQDCHGCL